MKYGPGLAALRKALGCDLVPLDSCLSWMQVEATFKYCVF